MSLNLENLAPLMRIKMAEEVSRDMAAGTLYISHRLNADGVKNYPALLLQAVREENDLWLAVQLQGKFNELESRNVKGKIINAKVPYNAADMLAEGEFNRFYLRGLWLHALEAGIKELVIYRAKQVTNPRPESEAKIGTTVAAAALLEDLRKNIGIDTALGLPSGPNSGLSARLP